MYSILILQSLVSCFLYGKIIVITTESNMENKQIPYEIKAFTILLIFIFVTMPLLPILTVVSNYPAALNVSLGTIANTIVENIANPVNIILTTVYLCMAIYFTFQEKNVKVFLFILALASAHFAVVNVVEGYAKSVINKYEILQCEDKPYMCQHKPKLDLMPKKIFEELRKEITQ